VFEGLVVEMAAELKRQRELRTSAGPVAAKTTPAFDPLSLGRMFLDQMHVYQASWRDDPQCDATNTHHAVPALPSPALDEETIRRLCRFAIANNFRWPPPGRPQRRGTARAALLQRLGSAAWSAPRAQPLVGLAATGAGGGLWTLALEEGQPASLHIGLPESRQATIWLAAEALERLLAGADSLAALRGNGSITIEGGDAANRSEAWKAVASIALPARRMAHSG